MPIQRLSPPTRIVTAVKTRSNHYQTAGADRPHYDGSAQTGSQAAFENNPTLGDDFPAEAAGSCSVGNAQSPHADG